MPEPRILVHGGAGTIRPDRLSPASVGGDGGLIALDREGDAVLAFSSRGMYRAEARAERPAQAAIYDEPLS